MTCRGPTMGQMAQTEKYHPGSHRCTLTPNLVHPRPRIGALGCPDDYPGGPLSGIDSLPLI